MMMMGEVEGETKVMQEKPSQEQIQLQQQQQPLKCPRCESTNTKFCYYNNYSLTQPRHFCKACKRYWTRGGTLRSVPVGGGCRKNKRVRRPSHFTTTTTTTTTATSNSSSNISESSNTFNSHSLNPSGIGGGGGGAHFINPLLYGPPTHPVSPHQAIINGFPFSSYDHHHQFSGLGLGFSSAGGIQLGCGDNGGNRNGYSTTCTKQILQDLISNSNPSSLLSPFHGSSNTNSTSSNTLPTMSMSSLLTSSLQHQQQKFNFESLFPYELDLHIKGAGSHGNGGGVYVKDDGMKMEGDGQIRIQNGYEIHDQHHQQPMGESHTSILWNNNTTTNGTNIGVNWLDPNYSSIGSSSVPSLI